MSMSPKALELSDNDKTNSRQCRGWAVGCGRVVGGLTSFWGMFVVLKQIWGYLSLS